MSIRGMICAALAVLLFWLAGGAVAEDTESGYVLFEEEEDHICAAAVELGLMPLRAAASAEEAEEPDANLGEASGDAVAVTIPADIPSLDWFEEKGLTLGESGVAYPSLKEGILSGDLTAVINDRILEDGHLRDYVTRISQLISGGRLKVSWRGEVLGNVFSFTIFADGAVETPRNTWVWTGGSIDLRDGHEVRAEELFADMDAARELMEEYLEGDVAPELSAHLLNSQMTPLPELFVLTERGIVWKYPIEQLSTLSDRAGDVLIPWRVVREQLRRDEGSILPAMGIAEGVMPLDEDTSEAEGKAHAALIQAMTGDGAIPGIPARLGDSLQALTEEWRMLIDPDVYARGRMFSLEGAAFRNVFLMTDFLSESWESSVVDGIRVDEGSVYGLSIGETTRAAWRQALGEPSQTIVYDAETAEADRTVPGSRDYYEFGGHRLQLHADEEGLLVSVILSE